MIVTDRYPLGRRETIGRVDFVSKFRRENKTIDEASCVRRLKPPLCQEFGLIVILMAERRQVDRLIDRDVEWERMVSSSSS